MKRRSIAALLGWLGAVGCAGTGGTPTSDFSHRVSFDLVAMKADAMDSIRVESVWSKHDKLVPGQPCWIHGSYSLSSPRGAIGLESVAAAGVVGNQVVEAAVITRQGRRSARRGEGAFDFIVEAAEGGLFRLVLAGSPEDPFGDYPDRMHVLVRLRVDAVSRDPLDALLRTVGAP